MMYITDAAQNHFYHILINNKKEKNIRIFVIHPGTSTAECGISYCLPENVEETDTEIKLKKIFFYIDALSKNYLEDAEMDFFMNNFHSQLTLKAPNVIMKKMDPHAPLKVRVEYFLQSKMNPQLAAHGGHVHLIEITNGWAIIKFGGSCNGCSMIHFTIQKGIQKELIHKFTEIKGVHDITEHKHGKHSYY